MTDTAIQKAVSVQVDMRAFMGLSLEDQVGCINRLLLVVSDLQGTSEALDVLEITRPHAYRLGPTLRTVERLLARATAHRG
ncbi:hypothetical protein ACMAUO_12675 [Gluconacetobacter sp. Hr-1-5]|uniref:hypothetical protein n=1 Tax=Gluconacetobacter sp. Hr-1-5 TaxID=3395370 RepID=UPI003B52B2A8